MLERIALHQTRLRTPGLGLDAKGVALGSKGVVLLPSVDRLVVLLAIYTRDYSLEDWLPSLAIRVVRSKLGTREMTLEFAAESSDRMDRIADAARLAGGYLFTGTSRHFVQYRDRAAPFGYDARELLSSSEALVLYHDKFTQTYDVDRDVPLKSLILRLMPNADPHTLGDPGPRYIVAEQGLGAALIQYFIRSHVDGEVCVGEWPPATKFDDAPVRRTIVRVADLPKRMRQLVQNTPGLTTFLPVSQGAAVQVGFRHPLSLRACPVFDSQELVFFRGAGAEPWVLERVPQMGDLRSFARVELLPQTAMPPLAPIKATTGDLAAPIRVPLRVMPSTAPWRSVNASFISKEQMPLFRALAYSLSPAVMREVRVASVAAGCFLRSASGIDAIPLGTFFRELVANLFVPAGFEVVPRVAPEVLQRALALNPAQLAFIGSDSRVRVIDESAFVPLETLLLEAPPWEPIAAEQIARSLEHESIDLKLSDMGPFPLSDAKRNDETKS